MEHISREEYLDYFRKFASTKDLRSLCSSYQTAKDKQPQYFKALFAHFTRDIWKVVLEELYLTPSATITTKELGYMVVAFKDAIEEVLDEVQMMPKMTIQTLIQSALHKHIE